jgi:hypothetical protein
MSNMVSGVSTEAIDLLSDVTAPVEQRLDVAKRLKNYIIGQDLRKEQAVRGSILPGLIRILKNIPRLYPVRRSESTDERAEHHVGSEQSNPWTPKDDLSLQAVLILGSLAAAGQPFLRPLCAINTPKLLVEALAVDVPSKIATAILEAIHNLAKFWSAAGESPVEGYDLWHAIFSEGQMDAFDVLLRQPTNSSAGRRQVQLIADIIALPADDHRCPNEHKAWPTTVFFIDTLASLLAAYAIDARHVLTKSISARLPPAPPKSVVPSIIAAISAIVFESTWCAHRFILSASVRELFLSQGTDERESFGPKHGFHNGYESLLPPMYLAASRSVTHTSRESANFPALAFYQSETAGPARFDHLKPLISDIDHSNAVCSWLIVLARSFQGMDRLAALRLLAHVVNAIRADPMGNLHKTEHAQKTRERERQLATLAIPLAISLVKRAAGASPSDDGDDENLTINLRSQACSVLALLVSSSRELQVASAQSAVFKSICPLLKKSFNAITPAKQMWSAKAIPAVTEDTPEHCRLGERGLSDGLMQAMRCRHGALTAIAALTDHEDSLRQNVIDEGAMSFMVDSLKPFPSVGPGSDKASLQHLMPEDGNTTPVLIAACRAAQCMARSVSVLRTSLVDGGIVSPLLRLLVHKNVDVRLATTDVCCNLVLTFSPMREELAAEDGQFVTTLAAHARSGETPELRIASMCALKNLVHDCSKEKKIAILDELGVSWLIGTIEGDQRDASAISNHGGVSVGLSTANAAGEQVDLLNPSTMDVDDVYNDEAMEGGYDDQIADEDDDQATASREDGEVLYDEASSTHYQDSQLRSTLQAPPRVFNPRRYLSSIRQFEENREYALKRNEAAMQAQALDFIRNLIHGNDATALIDHVTQQLGPNRLIELLTAKLMPISDVKGWPGTSATVPVYNPTPLILSTIHVCVHLATLSTHHRSLIMNHPALFRALLPHLRHSEAPVRSACLWVIANVTWSEDESDRLDAHARVATLRSMGFETAVKSMTDDPSLNVRERVKTALDQFRVSGGLT